MNGDGESPPTVDEFVDYCRTQAGLLSGEVETMRGEADALLDEIDEGVAEIRARLDAPDADPVDVAAVDELESDLEETQAVVETKEARMTAFRDLAAAYLELAADLESEADDAREALERVVRFEADRDAPAYFEDRQTVCEAAASGGSDAE